jgi:ABC-2 type transport system permease protein
VIGRAARLLIRLRLRRLFNLLSVGWRRGAPGERKGTARRGNWALPVFVLLVNLVGAVLLSVTTIGHARERLDGLTHGHAMSTSLPLSEAVQGEVALVVALACGVGLLMSLGTRELANPDWDLEWLATLPLPLRQLLVVRLAERTVLNPVAVLAVWPLLSVAAFFQDAGPLAPLAGLVVALPLLLIVGSLHLLADTGLRMRLTAPRLRNVQAVAGLTGMVGLYLVISAGQSDDSLVHGWAAALPGWFRWTPPGLAVNALTPREPGVIVGSLALLYASGALVAVGTLALLRHVLRDGLLAAGARESTRVVAAPRRRKGPRRFITALQARELKLLSRDRAFLVQTLLLPVVILGSQFVFGMRMTSSVLEDPRNLGAAAFAVMAYALLFSTFQTLAAEGHALWLLFTFPQSLDKLLREKARLWSVVALVFPSAVFAVGLASAPQRDWRAAAVALLVLSGVPIYATIGTCLGVLGWDPLAPDQRRRIRPGWAWLYMLLAGLFSYAIYSKSWWDSLVIVVLTGALALSLWQRVSDRLPYLLDPGEKPPPRVSLSDGMIAALLFFVLQGLAFYVLITLQRKDAPLDRALLPAYAIAGALTFLALRLVYAATRAEGVPRYFGGHGPAWHAAAPLAAAGAVIAAGYVLLLRGSGFMQAEIAQSIETLRGAPLALGALIIVVAPVVEEFLFRGLVFSGLRRSHGLLASAVLSAAIFAIVHPPASAAPVFLLGLLTAFAYERSGSLAAPVLVHAAFNASSFAMQVYWT